MKSIAVLHKIILWHHLRSLGNSAPAKATIIIPLIVYMIIFNEKIQEYLQISRDVFGFSSGIYSISTKVFLIYFGLCCVALASAFFSFFCPAQVKKFASPEEYIAGDETYMSDVGQALLDCNLSKGDSTAVQKIYELRAKYDYKPTPGNIDEMRRRDGKIYRDKMHIYYEMVDRKFIIIRCIVSSLFSVGIFFLIVPSIHVFVRVCQILIETKGI